MKKEFGSAVCISCGISFEKTGPNHKRCTPCREEHQKTTNRARSYEYMVKSGRIKNPGVGTGHAQGKGATHHSYKTGIGTYRQHKKSACEECGSTKFLCVHHLDGDRHNNIEENLITLCKRCHQIGHGAGEKLREVNVDARFKEFRVEKGRRIYATLEIGADGRFIGKRREE